MNNASKFDALFESLMAEAKNGEEQSKKVKLNVNEVEVGLKNGADVNSVTIKSTTDPKTAGSVEYDTPEDSKTVYDNLSSVGDVLNFLHVNIQREPSMYDLSSLMMGEVNAEIKKSADQIKKDGINFDMASYVRPPEEIEAV